MRKTITFDKFEAAGNDFVIIDARKKNELDAFARENGRILCDRHFGIGADGILIIGNTPNADAAMHIVNADGSIAAMCGNGIRCAARYLYESGQFKTDAPILIDTLGGIQTVRCLDPRDEHGQIAVDIARVHIENTVKIRHADHLYTGTKVDVGNPHAVFEVEEAPIRCLERSGDFLSHHEIFPDRSNIEFIREISADEIELAVFERGVGPTLACGTGCTASAAAYSAARNRTGNTVKIHAPGGDLSVRIPRSGDQKYELRGPARHVFTGQWPIA